MGILDNLKFWNRVEKTGGAPNFDPFFFAPTGISGNYLNNIQARPGQYHAWVHAACQAIIQPTCMLPIVLYSKKNDKKLIETHPILDLMRAPNPFMSGSNFLECILWDLLLTTMRTPGGQAFIIGEKPTNFRRGQIPQELWVLDDSFVTPRKDDNNILIGWTIGLNSKVNGSNVMNLSLDEVIRINLFNKYDMTKGMSPLASVLIEVDQDAKAKEFNTRFLENNASPGGMVTIDGSPPSPEIWKSIQTEFQQKNVGYRNAGKTLFLPWLLKFQQFANSHLDFAYMEQLGWNRDTVLSAYRVNKWSVGLGSDLNYAMAKVAERQLYENVIIPYCSLIFGELSTSWISHIGKGDLVIKADFSNVPALKEDMAVKIANAQKLIETGLPPEAAYAAVGLDIDTSPYPWMKENPNQAMYEEYAPKEPPKAGNPLPKSKDIETDKENREALSQGYIEKMFNPGEKEILVIMNRYFISQRNKVQDLIDENADKKNLKPSDLLPNKKEEDRRLELACAPAFIKQAKRTVTLTLRELPKKDLSEDSTNEEIAEFLQDRLESLSQINDTTFAGMESVLAEVIAQRATEEWSIQELSTKLKDATRDKYTSRLKNSKTIARTENGVVSGGVRQSMFKNAGIKKIEWLTAHDSDVRKSHERLDTKVIKLGEKFANGLRYPCDPEGEADEVINCRCVPLAVEEE